MRKIFSVCLLLSSLFINAQNKSYTVNGVIEGAEYNGKYIYLQKMSEDRRSLLKKDSVVIADNKFVFKNTLRSNDLELAIISIPDIQNAPQGLVILEKGTVEMKMGKPSLVSGTVSNDKLTQFMTEQEASKAKLEALFTKADYVETAEGAAQYDLILGEIRDKGFEYIRQNINNEVGEFFLFSLVQILEPAQVLTLLSESRPQFKNSAMALEMKTYFEKKAKTGKGSKFMDFSMPTPDGKTISLSDYAGKGKIVLVDFWASWCGPCIKEMPNVVKAYEEYKDKGFEIVGVSFDMEAGAWKGALTRLNMTWPQMSDLKGWKSEAGQLYGITSIPFTMLLDKDGTIIDTNLRGEQLINKLRSLLDK